MGKVAELNTNMLNRSDGFTEQRMPGVTHKMTAPHLSERHFESVSCLLNTEQCVHSLDKMSYVKKSSSCMNSHSTQNPTPDDNCHLLAPV